MEKLMELLRKYEIERRKNSCLIKKIPYGNNNDIKKNRFLIISKEYGFIKWLVDNDKIDTSKANDKNLNVYEIELRIRAVKELVADSEEKTVLYLNLLMLLAIQDKPIEFLISILK